MFSSSDFINPFSHLPSSSSSTFYHPLPLPPPPFVPQSNPVSNPSEVYPCNYQYHLSCTLDAASPPPVVLVTTHPPLPPEAVWNHGGKDGSVKLKRAAKKDRHSKICTAQGVRDRRVRLSIEIAREFFDLQEMLGFDRASKTLEWLLARSKKDINELALAKRKKQLDAHGPEEQISASTSLSAEKKQRKSTASGCGRADVTVARSARGREVRREQRSKPCCGSNKKKHHDELPSPQMCECEGGGVEDPAAMVRRLNYSKSPNPMISHYNQDSCFYGSPANCFWEPNTGVHGAQAPDGRLNDY